MCSLNTREIPIIITLSHDTEFATDIHERAELFNCFSSEQYSNFYLNSRTSDLNVLANNCLYVVNITLILS